MEQLFTIFLFAHAIAGSIALLAGSINMIRKKGTPIHARVGLVYFYAVLTNAVCAFFLAIYHPNVFLLSLGVMSFYLVFTGRGYLVKSKINGIVPIQPLDWALNIGLFSFGLLLIAFCIYQTIHGQFNFIPLVFALFSLSLSARVMLLLKKGTHTSPVELLRAHIGSMVGSYITIFSAFLVVNNHNYFPVLIGWFGPSVIFVPLIRIWKKKYGTV